MSESLLKHGRLPMVRATSGVRVDQVEEVQGLTNRGM
jgi:hypothetical protein